MTRGQDATVGVEGNACHRSPRAVDRRKRVGEIFSSEIPEANRTVDTARGEPLTVRAESDRGIAVVCECDRSSSFIKEFQIQPPALVGGETPQPGSALVLGARRRRRGTGNDREPSPIFAQSDATDPFARVR